MISLAKYALYSIDGETGAQRAEKHCLGPLSFTEAEFQVAWVPRAPVPEPGVFLLEDIQTIPTSSVPSALRASCCPFERQTSEPHLVSVPELIRSGVLPWPQHHCPPPISPDHPKHISMGMRTTY